LEPAGRNVGAFYGVDSISGQIDLHDGQSIYTVSLPIAETMAPGTWKLISVRLGQGVVKPVAILDNVSFEIPGPVPVVVRAQAPSHIEAGRQFVLNISVDQFPTDLGADCALFLQVYLRGAQPGSAPSQAFGSSPIPDVLLSQSQRTYEIRLGIAPDAPAGAYTGVISISARPTRLTTKFCRAPVIQGDRQFSFSVDPAAGLVAPAPVAGTLNPSQIELLIGEAGRMRAKADHLRSQLSSGEASADQNFLLASVQQAVADVDQTEVRFKEKGGSQSAKDVDTFFDDIRFEYGEALKVVTDSSALLPVSGAELDAVTASAGGSSSHLDRASEALVASILRNAKAYEVAASTKAITFTLDLISEPKGATISYRLRGEDYHILDHETDWRIENLPKATYVIRFQKQGYEDYEVAYDAIYSVATSIEAHLSRAPGAK
jgi:hypothetical protein